MTDAEKVESRFWSKVLMVENCWEWLGKRHRDGYGAFFFRGRMEIAHRVSYEMFVGRIPDGMEVDHLCRNRGCVNPSHLEAVTKEENMRRGFGVGSTNSKKSLCQKGHPLEGSNLAIRTRKDKRTSRVCILCRTTRNLSAYQSRKERALARLVEVLR